MVCSYLVATELLSKKGVSLEAVYKLPFNWLAADKSVAELAGQLRQIYPILKTPDAIHLATAVVAKADQFVTNDRLILGLKHVQNVSIIHLADVNTDISRVG